MTSTAAAGNAPASRLDVSANAAVDHATKPQTRAPDTTLRFMLNLGMQDCGKSQR
jgi:hypothetical protein